MKTNNLMNTYLANLAVWSVKLHILHWNVVGETFMPLHNYTKQLYDEAFDAFDQVGELLKMHNKMPVCTLKDYLEISTINEIESNTISCTEALNLITIDMVKMSDLAQTIRKKALESDDFQVVALFEGYIENFTKQLWFIRSIKKSEQPASCGCGCDCDCDC